MPRINLLPWREERRQERQRQFNMVVAGAAVLAALIVLYIRMTVGHFINYQQQRNSFLASEIKQVDAQIAAIRDLKKTRAELLARMHIIEQLQQSRSEIVHVFDQLVKTLPDGVYLTSVREQSDKLTMDGIAESSARVSTYMRNIDASDWLGDPELNIVQKSQKEKNGLRRQQFSVTAKVVSKQAAGKEAKGQ